MRTRCPPEAATVPGSGKALTVILKVTDSCNAACTFCSVGDPGRGRMSLDHVDRLVDELETLVGRWGLGRVQLTLHGGEPSLLGPAWIDEACRRARRLSVPVRLAMQSNLMAFSPELVDVALRHEIAVGSSIDPLFGERRDAGGADAFPRWLSNWERLTAAGLAIGAIFVVTRAALPHARRLYRIAESLGSIGGRRFGLQVNPVYPQGRATGSDVLVRDEEVGPFLLELWRTWEDSGRSVHLTPIERFATRFERPGRRSVATTCCFRGDCSRTHVGIDHELRVAGCGRRLDSGALLGSLDVTPLYRILEEADEKRTIASRSERLRLGDCAGCSFFDDCRGGCPDDAALTQGDLVRRHSWCAAYRDLFEALERRAADSAPARPPRARPPEPAPRRILRLSAGTAAAAAGDELWLPPDETGARWSFDSDLARVLDGSDTAVRVWLPNRHARCLPMWRDFVRSPRVRLVLYQAEGLAGALQAVNALGGRILLDVPAIAAAEAGAQALEDVFSRYRSDPGWRSPIGPIHGLVSRRFRRDWVAPRNRFGLGPGAFELTGDSPAGPAFEGLADDARRTPAAWLLARRACLGCEHFRVCGGCLTDAEGVCSPAAHRLATAAAELGEELAHVLAGTRAQPSA